MLYAVGIAVQSVVLLVCGTMFMQSGIS